jgi:hypothetical protein
MSPQSAHRPSVPRNAAELRRLVHRETRRMAAGKLAVYVHGPAGTIRLSGGDHDRATAPAGAALDALRALPDRAGAQAAIQALRQAAAADQGVRA